MNREVIKQHKKQTNVCNKEERRNNLIDTVTVHFGVCQMSEDQRAFDVVTKCEQHSKAPTYSSFNDTKMLWYTVTVETKTE